MAKLFPTKKNYTGLSALILQNTVSDFQVRRIFVNIWNLKKKHYFFKKSTESSAKLFSSKTVLPSLFSIISSLFDFLFEKRRSNSFLQKIYYQSGPKLLKNSFWQFLKVANNNYLAYCTFSVSQGFRFQILIFLTLTAT